MRSGFIVSLLIYFRGFPLNCRLTGTIIFSIKLFADYFLHKLFGWFPQALGVI